MNIAFAVLLVAARPEASLENFTKDYGLRADVRRSAFTDQALGYTISGTPATDAMMAKYRDLWMREWALYPTGLMKKAKVKKIVFCEGLRVDEQYRAAVPSFDLEAMYYDPALGAGIGNYQQSVIHHEFFHMIDQRMGVLYIDKEWSALNPKGFSYGTGGANMRDENAGVLTAKIPGFLTAYGTAAVEEDKAELFAKLIVDADFVAERAKTDRVLAAKIVLLKKRLARFHTEMGSGFWKKVAALDQVRKTEKSLELYKGNGLIPYDIATIAGEPIFIDVKGKEHLIMATYYRHDRVAQAAAKSVRERFPQVKVVDSKWAENQVHLVSPKGMNSEKEAAELMADPSNRGFVWMHNPIAWTTWTDDHLVRTTTMEKFASLKAVHPSLVTLQKELASRVSVYGAEAVVHQFARRYQGLNTIVDVIVERGDQAEWFQSDGNSVSRATLPGKFGLHTDAMYDGYSQYFWSD